MLYPNCVLFAVDDCTEHAMANWLSVTAIIVSIAAVCVSFWIYRNNRKVNMKPVVVFTKDKPTEDDKEGWHLCNVGNGPAINITVARRPENGSWQDYCQCPTLASGENYPIKLGGYELQCDYYDIDEKLFSSRCKHWVTSFPNERLPKKKDKKPVLSG